MDLWRGAAACKAKQRSVAPAVRSLCMIRSPLESRLEPRIRSVIHGRLGRSTSNSNFLSLFCALTSAPVLPYLRTDDHVYVHRSNNKHLLAGYHLRPIHLMSSILKRYPALCRESIDGLGPSSPFDFAPPPSGSFRSTSRRTWVWSYRG